MNNRSFFVSQALISLAINAANALNIVFMLIALRLPIEAFGEISTILAITFLFSLGQTSARNQLLLIFQETKNLDRSIVRTLQTIMPISLAECLLLSVGGAFAASFLHFTSPLPFIIVSLSAITYALNGILQGIFATEKSSKHHALSLFVESVYRLPIAILFLANGYQSEDAAWIMLLASTGALVTNVCVLPAHLRAQLKKIRLTLAANGDLKTALGILASTILVGVALKIDIIWSKHVLTSEAAGIYGMMNFVASVLFLGSSGIGRASLSFLGKGDFRSLMKWSYGIMMAICSLCVIGFYTIGLPLLSWVSPHGSAIDPVVQMTLFAAATGYCVINFNFQCMSVMHKNIHILLSGALVSAQTIGLLFLGNDMESIALVQAGIMIVFAVLDTFLLLRSQKYHGMRHALHLHHPVA